MLIYKYIRWLKLIKLYCNYSIDFFTWKYIK